MDQSDVELRNLTYRLFIELGRAPTVDDVAREAALDRSEAEAGWRRLHGAHALVLDPDTDEIRMANPFSAVPTIHRVHSGDRWWYANCAWDAIGICAALNRDGRIESSCPDCAAPIAFEIRNRLPSDTTLLFHSLVPASCWWEDIVFT